MKNSSLICIAAMFIGFSVAGCSLAPGDDSDREIDTSLIELKTDSLVYEEGAGLIAITYTYENKSEEDFLLGLCLGTFSSSLQKLVDGEWIVAFPRACVSDADPLMVEAKSSRQFSVNINTAALDRPTDANWSDEVEELDGTYRIFEWVFNDFDRDKYRNSQYVPETVPIYSNTFELRSSN